LTILHRGSADNFFISSPCVVALLAGCAVFFGGADELGLSDLGGGVDIVSLLCLGYGITRRVV
jgi:hypothetical protein